MMIFNEVLVWLKANQRGQNYWKRMEAAIAATRPTEQDTRRVERIRRLCEAVISERILDGREQTREQAIAEAWLHERAVIEATQGPQPASVSHPSSGVSS